MLQSLWKKLKRSQPPQDTMNIAAQVERISVATADVVVPPTLDTTTQIINKTPNSTGRETRQRQHRRKTPATSTNAALAIATPPSVKTVYKAREKSGLRYDINEKHPRNIPVGTCGIKQSSNNSSRFARTEVSRHLKTHVQEGGQHTTSAPGQEAGQHTTSDPGQEARHVVAAAPGREVRYNSVYHQRPGSSFTECSRASSCPELNKEARFPYIPMVRSMSESFVSSVDPLMNRKSASIASKTKCTVFIRFRNNTQDLSENSFLNRFFVKVPHSAERLRHRSGSETREVSRLPEDDAAGVRGSAWRRKTASLVQEEDREIDRQYSSPASERPTLTSSLKKVNQQKTGASRKSVTISIASETESPDDRDKKQLKKNKKNKKKKRKSKKECRAEQQRKKEYAVDVCYGDGESFNLLPGRDSDSDDLPEAMFAAESNAPRYLLVTDTATGERLTIDIPDCDEARPGEPMTTKTGLLYFLAGMLDPQQTNVKPFAETPSDAVRVKELKVFSNGTVNGGGSFPNVKSIPEQSCDVKDVKNVAPNTLNGSLSDVKAFPKFSDTSHGNPNVKYFTPRYRDKKTPCDQPETNVFSVKPFDSKRRDVNIVVLEVKSQLNKPVDVKIGVDTKIGVPDLKVCPTKLPSDTKNCVPVVTMCSHKHSEDEAFKPFSDKPSGMETSVLETPAQRMPDMKISKKVSFIDKFEYDYFINLENVVSTRLGNGQVFDLVPVADSFELRCNARGSATTVCDTDVSESHTLEQDDVESRTLSERCVNTLLSVSPSNPDEKSEASPEQSCSRISQGILVGERLSAENGDNMAHAQDEESVTAEGCVQDTREPSGTLLHSKPWLCSTDTDLSRLSSVSNMESNMTSVSERYEDARPSTMTEFSSSSEYVVPGDRSDVTATATHLSDILELSEYSSAEDKMRDAGAVLGGEKTCSENETSFKSVENEAKKGRKSSSPKMTSHNAIGNNVTPRGNASTTGDMHEASKRQRHVTANSVTYRVTENKRHFPPNSKGPGENRDGSPDNVAPESRQQGRARTLAKGRVSQGGDCVGHRDRDDSETSQAENWRALLRPPAIVERPASPSKVLRYYKRRKVFPSPASEHNKPETSPPASGKSPLTNLSAPRHGVKVLDREDLISHKTAHRPRKSNFCMGEEHGLDSLTSESTTNHHRKSSRNASRAGENVSDKKSNAGDRKGNVFGDTSRLKIITASRNHTLVSEESISCQSHTAVTAESEYDKQRSGNATSRRKMTKNQKPSEEKREHFYDRDSQRNGNNSHVIMDTKACRARAVTFPVNCNSIDYPRQVCDSRNTCDRWEVQEKGKRSQSKCRYIGLENDASHVSVNISKEKGNEKLSKKPLKCYRSRKHSAPKAKLLEKDNNAHNICKSKSKTSVLQKNIFSLNNDKLLKPNKQTHGTTPKATMAIKEIDQCFTKESASTRESVSPGAIRSHSVLVTKPFDLPDDGDGDMFMSTSANTWYSLDESYTTVADFSSRHLNLRPPGSLSTNSIFRSSCSPSNSNLSKNGDSSTTVLPLTRCSSWSKSDDYICSYVNQEAFESATTYPSDVFSSLDETDAISSSGVYQSSISLCTTQRGDTRCMSSDHLTSFSRNPSVMSTLNNEVFPRQTMASKFAAPSHHSRSPVPKDPLRLPATHDNNNNGKQKGGRRSKQSAYIVSQICQESKHLVARQPKSESRDTYNSISEEPDEIKSKQQFQIASRAMSAKKKNHSKHETAQRLGNLNNDLPTNHSTPGTDAVKHNCSPSRQSRKLVQALNDHTAQLEIPSVRKTRKPDRIRNKQTKSIVSSTGSEMQNNTKEHFKKVNHALPSPKAQCAPKMQQKEENKSKNKNHTVRGTNAAPHDSYRTEAINHKVKDNQTQPRTKLINKAEKLAGLRSTGSSLPTPRRVQDYFPNCDDHNAKLNSAPIHLQARQLHKPVKQMETNITSSINVERDHVLTEIEKSNSISAATKTLDGFQTMFELAKAGNFQRKRSKSRGAQAIDVVPEWIRARFIIKGKGLRSADSISVEAATLQNTAEVSRRRVYRESRRKQGGEVQSDLEWKQVNERVFEDKGNRKGANYERERKYSQLERNHTREGNGESDACPHNKHTRQREIPSRDDLGQRIKRESALEGIKEYDRSVDNQEMGKGGCKSRCQYDDIGGKELHKDEIYSGTNSHRKRMIEQIWNLVQGDKGNRACKSFAKNKPGEREEKDVIDKEDREIYSYLYSDIVEKSDTMSRDSSYTENDDGDECLSKNFTTQGRNKCRMNQSENLQKLTSDEDKDDCERGGYEQDKGLRGNNIRKIVLNNKMTEFIDKDNCENDMNSRGNGNNILTRRGNAIKKDFGYEENQQRNIIPYYKQNSENEWTKKQNKKFKSHEKFTRHEDDKKLETRALSSKMEKGESVSMRRQHGKTTKNFRGNEFVISDSAGGTHSKSSMRCGNEMIKGQSGMVKEDFVAEYDVASDTGEYDKEMSQGRNSSGRMGQGNNVSRNFKRDYRNERDPSLYEESVDYYCNNNTVFGNYNRTHQTDKIKLRFVREDKIGLNEGIVKEYSKSITRNQAENVDGGSDCDYDKPSSSDLKNNYHARQGANNSTSNQGDNLKRYLRNEDDKGRDTDICNNNNTQIVMLLQELVGAMTKGGGEEPRTLSRNSATIDGGLTTVGRETATLGQEIRKLGREPTTIVQEPNALSTESKRTLDRETNVCRVNTYVQNVPRAGPKKRVVLHVKRRSNTRKRPYKESVDIKSMSGPRLNLEAISRKSSMETCDAAGLVAGCNTVPVDKIAEALAATEQRATRLVGKQAQLKTKHRSVGIAGDTVDDKNATREVNETLLTKLEINDLTVRQENPIGEPYLASEQGVNTPAADASHKTVDELPANLECKSKHFALPEDLNVLQNGDSSTTKLKPAADIPTTLGQQLKLLLNPQVEKIAVQLTMLEHKLKYMDLTHNENAAVDATTVFGNDVTYIPLNSQSINVPAKDMSTVLDNVTQLALNARCDNATAEEVQHCQVSHVVPPRDGLALEEGVSVFAVKEEKIGCPSLLNVEDTAIGVLPTTLEHKLKQLSTNRVIKIAVGELPTTSKEKTDSLSTSQRKELLEMCDQLKQWVHIPYASQANTKEEQLHNVIEEKLNLLSTQVENTTEVLAMLDQKINGIAAHGFKSAAIDDLLTILEQKIQGIVTRDAMNTSTEELIALLLENVKDMATSNAKNVAEEKLLAMHEDKLRRLVTPLNDNGALRIPGEKKTKNLSTSKLESTSVELPTEKQKVISAQSEVLTNTMSEQEANQLFATRLDTTPEQEVPSKLTATKPRHRSSALKQQSSAIERSKASYPMSEQKVLVTDPIESTETDSAGQPTMFERSAALSRESCQLDRVLSVTDTELVAKTECAEARATTAYISENQQKEATSVQLNLQTSGTDITQLSAKFRTSSVADPSGLIGQKDAGLRGSSPGTVFLNVAGREVADVTRLGEKQKDVISFEDRSNEATTSATRHVALATSSESIIQQPTNYPSYHTYLTTSPTMSKTETDHLQGNRLMYETREAWHAEPSRCGNHGKSPTSLGDQSVDTWLEPSVGHPNKPVTLVTGHRARSKVRCRIRIRHSLVGNSNAGSRDQGRTSGYQGTVHTPLASDLKTGPSLECLASGYCGNCPVTIPIKSSRVVSKTEHRNHGNSSTIIVIEPGATTKDTNQIAVGVATRATVNSNSFGTITTESRTEVNDHQSGSWGSRDNIFELLNRLNHCTGLTDDDGETRSRGSSEREMRARKRNLSMRAIEKTRVNEGSNGKIRARGSQFDDIRARKSSDEKIRPRESQYGEIGAMKLSDGEIGAKEGQFKEIGAMKRSDNEIGTKQGQYGEIVAIKSSDDEIGANESQYGEIREIESSDDEIRTKESKSGEIIARKSIDENFRARENSDLEIMARGSNEICSRMKESYDGETLATETSGEMPMMRENNYERLRLTDSNYEEKRARNSRDGKIGIRESNDREISERESSDCETRTMKDKEQARAMDSSNGNTQARETTDGNTWVIKSNYEESRALESRYGNTRATESSDVELRTRKSSDGKSISRESSGRSVRVKESSDRKNRARVSGDAETMNQHRKDKNERAVRSGKDGHGKRGFVFRNTIAPIMRAFTAGHTMGEPIVATYRAWRGDVGSDHGENT